MYSHVPLSFSAAVSKLFAVGSVQPFFLQEKSPIEHIRKLVVIAEDSFILRLIYLSKLTFQSINPLKNSELMKKIKLIAVILICIVGLFSCKALAKGAAKWWTKKQIKEFVTDCEAKSSKLIGEERAAKYCSCAVDEVAGKYNDFEDVKKAGIVEVLKIAKDCK